MINGTANNAAFRMRDLANRDRTKGQISWAVDVSDTLTVTPNGGFLYDDYRTDICFTAPGCQAGMKKANSWNAGADAMVNLNRMVALMFSYNYDRGYRQVYENSAVPDAEHRDADQNHTFIVGGKFTLIPGKLFLDANFAHTFSVSQWTSSCTPAGCLIAAPNPLPIFPDTHNTNDRLDVQAKYMFDEAATRGWGLWPKSQAYVKARVRLGAQLQRCLAAAAGAVWFRDPRRQHQRHHDQFVLDGHRQSELQRGLRTAGLRREVVSAIGRST